MAPASPTAFFLGRAAALLIILSLLTGFLLVGARGGFIPAESHSMLGAHLTALLGAFWMLGVAWSLPLLRYSEQGLRRLAWLLTFSAYANWFITVVKSFLHVTGVNANGDPRNDGILVLLVLFAVLPSLVAAIVWFRGFRRA